MFRLARTRPAASAEIFEDIVMSLNTTTLPRINGVSLSDAQETLTVEEIRIGI